MSGHLHLSEKLRQIWFVCLQHLIQDLFRDRVGRNERIDRHRHQRRPIIPRDRRFTSDTFKEFDLLDETPDSNGQFSYGNRNGTFSGDHAVDLDGGVARNAGNRSVVLRVYRLDIACIVVDGVDKLHAAL